MEKLQRLNKRITAIMLLISMNMAHALDLPSFAEGKGDAKTKINAVFENIYQLLQWIGVALIGISIVIAGITWLMSEDKGEEAKQKIKNIIIGGVIIGGGTTLVGYVLSSL